MSASISDGHQYCDGTKLGPQKQCFSMVRMISPRGDISPKTLVGRPLKSQGKSVLGKEILQKPPGSQELEPLGWGTMGDTFGASFCGCCCLDTFLVVCCQGFHAHLWLDTVYLG